MLTVTDITHKWLWQPYKEVEAIIPQLCMITPNMCLVQLIVLRDKVSAPINWNMITLGIRFFLKMYWMFAPFQNFKLLFTQCLYPGGDYDNWTELKPIILSCVLTSCQDRMYLGLWFLLVAGTCLCWTIHTLIPCTYQTARIN